MIAAIIMLLTLPTFKDLLNVPVTVSVAAILLLGFAAGFTNPKQTWDAGINATISTVGFLIFESAAVWTYQQHFNTDQAEKFFLTNIGLGLLFLIAIYFSVKTLRGLMLIDDAYNNIIK